MGKDIVNINDQKSAMDYLTTFCKTKFCPDAYINKPEEAFIACSVGRIFGLGAFASLQNIAVINKRPCIWGDALKGIVIGQCVEFREEFDEETFTAKCTIVRKGFENCPTVYSFSWNDAEQAGLTKKGVWTQYPKRMIQMRARGFAIRDAFADFLAGIITTEEAMDYPASALDTSSLNEAMRPKEELQEIAEKQEAKEKAKSQKKTDRLAAKLVSRPAPVVKKPSEQTEQVEEGEIVEPVEPEYIMVEAQESIIEGDDKNV
jgi:hypothetical protein